MHKLKINGGTPLRGKVVVSGSKNATLAIMTAAILTNEEIVLSNVPNLMDVRSMNDLLQNIGCGVEFAPKEDSFDHILKLRCNAITKLEADYDLVRKMRASILVLGPMLARFKKAKVSLPGGCAIGTRPIDMHLSALEAMGAQIKLEQGYIIASAAKGLIGTEIFFDKVSVGATENILMAATLASGETIIHNAAREPEITDLANFLVAMGAQIDGIGSDILKINGAKKLNGCAHRIIPDRIEAGTFAIMAAATNGKLSIENCQPKHLSSLIHHLKTVGICVEEYEDSLCVYRNGDHILATNIQTAAYPNFPTDLQAQFMALLISAVGTSHVTEHIYENRFMHTSELLRMNANITVNDNIAIINGVDCLKPAEVMASDLRASAALIIAALCIKGESIINRIYHLDRGYERIEVKLRSCGADIERVE